MFKRGISILIIFLITITSVYSLSLVNKDTTISSIEIKEVYINNNQIKILISSNKEVKGLIVTLDNNQQVILNNNINPFESKFIYFYIKEVPKVIEISSYIELSHNRIVSDPIFYRVQGTESQFQEQQSISIIQQQVIQEFNNKPNYISYTSISKLDDNKNIVYYTKDHLSSNRITTNQQGNIVYQANYQPYGSIFNSQGEEKYKFSNKELDNSNLYYFGARYYNPKIGRFTQLDPIFKPQESPYSYANNNPIKYIDPTGKKIVIQNYNIPESEWTDWGSYIELTFTQALKNSAIPGIIKDLTSKEIDPLTSEHEFAINIANFEELDSRDMAYKPQEGAIFIDFQKLKVNLEKIWNKETFTTESIFRETLLGAELIHEMVHELDIEDSNRFPMHHESVGKSNTVGLTTSNELKQLFREAKQLEQRGYVASRLYFIRSDYPSLRKDWEGYQNLVKEFQERGLSLFEQAQHEELRELDESEQRLLQSMKQ